jgi:hypothetical protein
MDSMRLTVLGVLTRHDPEATGWVEVVPAHTPNFIAALAREGQKPDDCSECIAHLVGGREYGGKLVIVQGAMTGLLARRRCDA